MYPIFTFSHIVKCWGLGPSGRVEHCLMSSRWRQLPFASWCVFHLPAQNPMIIMIRWAGWWWSSPEPSWPKHVWSFSKKNMFFCPLSPLGRLLIQPLWYLLIALGYPGATCPLEMLLIYSPPWIPVSSLLVHPKWYTYSSGCKISLIKANIFGSPSSSVHMFCFAFHQVVLRADFPGISQWSSTICCAGEEIGANSLQRKSLSLPSPILCFSFLFLRREQCQLVLGHPWLPPEKSLLLGSVLGHMYQCSEVTPGSVMILRDHKFRGPYWILGIQPMLVVCKARPLPAVISISLALEFFYVFIMTIACLDFAITFSLKYALFKMGISPQHPRTHWIRRNCWPGKLQGSWPSVLGWPSCDS